MGYTHYWNTEKVTKEDKVGFKKAQPIFEKILEKYKDILQLDYDDDKDPLCEYGVIRFNGIEDDGHETFYFNINKQTAYDLCKTARKPYDLPVCEILEVIKHFCPNVEITSDGFDGDLRTATNMEDNWSEAIRNVKCCF